MTTRADAVLERFAAACRGDDWVVVAFLGGSHARGAADEHSDLDLYLVVADRDAFVRRLGEPVFCEYWRARHGFDLVFFVLADGLEAELGLGRESGFLGVHGGAHRVLVDKKGVLDGVTFPVHRPGPAEQVETLRGQIEWFWHDLSHVAKAMARGQVWWAYGALDDLRRTCVQLARLRHDFAAVPEGYEKVDDALPPELLALPDGLATRVRADLLLADVLRALRWPEGAIAVAPGDRAGAGRRGR